MSKQTEVMTKEQFHMYLEKKRYEWKEMDEHVGLYEEWYEEGCRECHIKADGIKALWNIIEFMEKEIDKTEFDVAKEVTEFMMQKKKEIQDHADKLHEDFGIMCGDGFF